MDAHHAGVEINSRCQGVPVRKSVRLPSGRRSSAFEFPGCGQEATLGLYGALTADNGGGTLFVVGTCREHFRATRRLFQGWSPEPIEGASLDVIKARWTLFVDEGFQAIADVA